MQLNNKTTLIKRVKQGVIILSVISIGSMFYTLPKINNAITEYRTLKTDNTKLSKELKEVKAKYQTSLDEILTEKTNLIRTKSEYSKSLQASADRLEKEIKETKRTKKMLNTFSNFLDKNNQELKGQVELLTELNNL